MRATWIALGAAFGLAVWSPGAPAQEALEAPAAPVAIQGVVAGAAVAPAPVVVDEPSLPFQPHPYSYYVAYPAPARTYVGYGPMNQFPFYGQAYGNPGDRWSWSGMMGNRAAGLDRYYYQLLP